MNNVRFLYPLVADIRFESEGWASQSLQRSIGRAAFLILAGWQAVMVLAILTTLGPRVSTLALIGAHLCISLYALLAATRPLPAPPILLCAYGVGLADYLMSPEIGSALTFAACWLVDLASCATALLVLRRVAIPLTIVPSALIAVGLLVAYPSRGWDLPIAILVTQPAILMAFRLGLPSLLRFAQRSDDETAATERAVREVEVQRTTSRKIAEDTRLLHDTAINTLLAIANDGAAVLTNESVRRQCASDVVFLSSLRRSPLQAASDHVSLHEVFGMPGLPVHRSGLDDEALQRVNDRLSQETIRAVLGCAREAMTNAAKHSGADHVDVCFRVRGADLALIMRDDGVGFSGAFDADHGLANSVFARASENGIAAELETATGQGTGLILQVPLAHPGEPEGRPNADGPEEAATIDEENIASVVSRLHVSAGSLWSVGVTAVSVILTAMGGANHYFALYPMMLVMGGSWAMVRHSRRNRPGTRLSTRVITVLLLNTCLVFTLSAAAVDFGSSGVVDWQALAATGPFALFLSARPSRPVLRIGLGVWAATVGALSVAVLPSSSNAAVIVIVAGAAGIGFALAWNHFLDTVSRLGFRISETQRRRFLAQLTAEMQTAAQATYKRWLEAGLDLAIHLLEGVANGDIDPAAKSTQEACRREEAYLRQFTLISPELMHLGHAVIPTLARARARDVKLTLKLGMQDAPRADVAQEIAAMILMAVRSAQQGASLVGTVFPVRQGMQLTLIGPASSLGAITRPTGARTLVADISGQPITDTESLLQVTFRPAESTEHGTRAARRTLKLRV